MILKDIIDSIDINAPVAISVRNAETGEEMRRRFRTWERCPYTKCEVNSISIKYDELLISVTPRDRLERPGNGNLVYIDEDGYRYEIGSVSTADFSDQKSYDMGIIMRWFETFNDKGEWESCGYELIGYFQGITCFSDDEIREACRDAVFEYKNRLK